MMHGQKNINLCEHVGSYMEYPHTAKARVQLQVSLYEIRCRKSNKRTSFSTPISVFPYLCDSTNFPRAFFHLPPHL